MKRFLDDSQTQTGAPPAQRVAVPRHAALAISVAYRSCSSLSVSTSISGTIASASSSRSPVSSSTSSSASSSSPPLRLRLLRAGHRHRLLRPPLLWRHTAARPSHPRLLHRLLRAALRTERREIYPGHRTACCTPRRRVCCRVRARTMLASDQKRRAMPPAPTAVKCRLSNAPLLNPGPHGNPARMTHAPAPRLLRSAGPPRPRRDRPYTRR